MQQIKDNNDMLLAIILRYENNFKKEKYFVTENDQEMQVASFNLPKGTVIENHIHLKQERNVTSTSEVIVLIEGKLKVDIYDEELTLVTSEVITDGDVVALFEGGHGITVLEKSKFIESKQGPYLMDLDKKGFKLIKVFL